MSSLDPIPPDAAGAARRQRRRRRGAGSIVALIVGASVVAAAVGAAALVVVAVVPTADAAVTAAESTAVLAVVDELAEVNTQLQAANADYTDDTARWAAYVAAADDARAVVDVPAVGAPNPGGTAMPGDDPTGRAFLDSVGATDVSVQFDAGPNNCGFAGDTEEVLSVGGCVNSAYPTVIFMAWEEGMEDSVWPIFVHEVMHWYQNETWLELGVAVSDAGIDAQVWSDAVETDASCRAVVVYGIPIEDYADTSAPCTIGDWTEDWLPNRAAELGAIVATPDPEAYEVFAVVRP